MEAATDHDNISLRVASFSCYLDTAKENLVHRVSAQEAPILFNSGKTKPPTAKPPPSSASFSYSKGSKDSLRVDSFSYLNTAGENFVFNVPTGPIQDPNPAFSFSHEIPKDGREISVFGADKYFNMKLEYPMRIKRDSKADGPGNLPRGGSNSTRARPPSVRSESEASTWNSQTALLPSNFQARTKQKRAVGRRILAGFGCQGPCFDKKAVRVNELIAQEACYGAKPSRTGSERIDHLALAPVPNPGTGNFTVKKQLPGIANLEESRDSIEVFGSGTTSKKGDIATNMERKLSMLTWDAIPKGQNPPTSTVGSGTICDDMASDASSDLFEIENISGSMYPVQLTAADDMSICMSPASQYAPSEASIQWSVVTASAADYSSVLSDYNDENSVSVMGDKTSRIHATVARNRGGKEALKSRPGNLLGCKSHKAVDVAENVCHKSNEKAKHHGLDLPTVKKVNF
ncbi:protein PHYTOCHROME KINASE SUBSTRATE 1 [Sesamum alatum]|uniref:Protein PHYTOCHROME KINASE SUBSTRATE 1 n=1 Tax=Sesamum alatum TaxID=300844 RepID=A0AAE1YWJ0_9LAMI|nr:protein PHYTOCHROME KINASE SUBSTRATE 1 [Sesamum alatum]